MLVEKEYHLLSAFQIFLIQPRWQLVLLVSYLPSSSLSFLLSSCLLPTLHLNASLPSPFLISNVYYSSFLTWAYLKVGAAFPIWGLLLASVEDIFYYTDMQELRDAGGLVATRFIMLGICCLIGYTLQYYCIAQVGQRISTGI